MSLDAMLDHNASQTRSWVLDFKGYDNGAILLSSGWSHMAKFPLSLTHQDDQVYLALALRFACLRESASESCVNIHAHLENIEFSVCRQVDSEEAFDLTDTLFALKKANGLH